MITKVALTTLFILNLKFILYSQVTQEWIARFNGPGNNYDMANSITVDSFGNVFVTGYTRNNGADDYATLKYNSSGIQQWVQIYSSPGRHSDRACVIKLDNLGNVYVTGSSYVSDTLTYDFATIKYSSSGIQQWIAIYDGPEMKDDEPTAMTLDNFGNIYVTGYSRGLGTSRDCATIKYNSSGVQQWVARYNGQGDDFDQSLSVVVDDSGNVFITGYSYTGNITGNDYLTIKYDSMGVQQWLRLYSGLGNLFDEAFSIAIDKFGNVFVTGFINSFLYQHDWATIKYNSLGMEQWIRLYNSPTDADDRANSVAVDNSGNVYVTGYSALHNKDYLTIKYNFSGDSLWVKRYNGPGNTNDEANSIVIDNLGNVYITGYSLGAGTLNDYATIKYSSSGILQWIERYNGPLGNGEDVANSLAVDNQGNVYVTGGSAGNGSSYDYATIKYSQLTGLNPISSEIPSHFSLSQNYPNPFNPETHLRFEISDLRFVKLVIYDILGKEVATLVNEQLKPGVYEVEWDATNFPSGVYLYRIVAAEFTETKKMILLK